MPSRARFLFRFLGLLIVFGIAAPAAATAETIEAFAQRIGETVLATVRDPSLARDAKQERLHKMFTDIVDVDWIGRFALGRHWRAASQEQKDLYLRYYRKFLTDYYTSKFANYNGESFHILSTREDEGDYVIAMEVVRPGGANVLIDYKARKAGASYKIYDIVVEGVSLIATQRSEYSSVISRKGLDYLIGQLGKKVS